MPVAGFHANCSTEVSLNRSTYRIYERLYENGMGIKIYIKNS